MNKRRHCEACGAYLSNQVPSVEKRTSKIKIETVIKVVAREFSMSVEELLSDKQTVAYAFPRQVAMYLSDQLTRFGVMKIGREFYRDHTTVKYAVDKITKAIKANPGHLAKEIEAIKQAVLDYEALRSGPDARPHNGNGSTHSSQSNSQLLGEQGLSASDDDARHHSNHTAGV